MFLLSKPRAPRVKPSGRKEIAVGFGLLLAGIFISALGMAIPGFSGGGLPPPGEHVRFYSALETPLGVPLVLAAVAGWSCACGSYFAPADWRGRLGRAATVLLVALAILLFAVLVSAPLDAGGLGVGGLAAGLGFVLSAFGARFLARIPPPRATVA